MAFQGFSKRVFRIVISSPRRELCVSSHLSLPYQHFVPPLHHVHDVDYSQKIEVPEDFRYVYRDFLPNPVHLYRNKLKEKLERQDMIARRQHLDIPEFYPGSILAVTTSNEYANGGSNRFLGICIARTGQGLFSGFILRNVIDRLGVEIHYRLYNPLITSIEIIKLEKRLDENLMYLRDALPEFSTFPQDMDPVQLPDGMEVPLNPIKVKLKPRPWSVDYNAKLFKGLEHDCKFNNKRMVKQELSADRKKLFLMDTLFEYKSTISNEEIALIYKELLPHLPKFEAARRRIRKMKLHV